MSRKSDGPRVLARRTAETKRGARIDPDAPFGFDTKPKRCQAESSGNVVGNRLSGLDLSGLDVVARGLDGLDDDPGHLVGIGVR